jgi:hypothetical protein
MIAIGMIRERKDDIRKRVILMPVSRQVVLSLSFDVFKALCGKGFGGKFMLIRLLV